MKDERHLLAELAKVRRAPHGKRIIHFFCSWAAQDADFTHKHRDAVRRIQSALSVGAHHEVFSLQNGDIVAVFSQVSSAAIMGLIAQIQAHVLGSRLPQRNVYNEVGFGRLFDASRELDRLITGIRAVVSERADSAAPTRLPITVNHYNSVSEALGKTDIRSMVFNQPVYYTAHATPSIEFIEFYVAVSKLEDTLCPGYSLSANPWLFNLVKREMDGALMRSIQNEIADYRHRAFSLNAQVSTFLTQSFEAFIRAMPTKLMGRIYVELDKADLIEHSADMGKILERSRELSVPLCIDGLSHHDLQLLKISNVEADYIKIKWSAEMASMTQQELSVFVREIKHSSGRKIVLTRCDSPKALAFAKAVGVEFIQGRLADKFFKIGADMYASA